MSDRRPRTGRKRLATRPCGPEILHHHRPRPSACLSGSSERRAIGCSGGGQAAFDQARPVADADGDDVVVEIVGRVVQPGGVAVADEDEGAGPRLAACRRSPRRPSPAAASVSTSSAPDTSAATRRGELRLGRVVDGHGIAADIVELGRRRHASCATPATISCMRRSIRSCIAGVEGAHGAAQLGRLRQDVEGLAGLEHGDRDHGGVAADRRCARRWTAAPARSALPITTGSMALCGCAAWPPRPSMVMVKRSAAAIMRAGADARTRRPAGPACCACRRPR